MVLGLTNYERCDQCGVIAKSDMKCDSSAHVLLSSTSISETRTGQFVKNENDETCRYCGRYLMKCLECDNPCYVCVFRNCAKSQLNGNRQEYSTYLCNDHAKVATNCWTTGHWVGTSDTLCDTCGMNDSIYTAACQCLGSDYRCVFCINCQWEDAVMYRIYCYSCA
jgi:hypothetical protein